jgi:branched-chain amino acid transport system substrate-binding protein
MKKIASIVLLLCFAFVMVFSGCGGDKSASSDSNVIKIGVYEPSSGDNGAGGKQEVLGIEYANSLVNTVEVDGKPYNVQKYRK